MKRLAEEGKRTNVNQRLLLSRNLGIILKKKSQPIKIIIKLTNVLAVQDKPLNELKGKTNAFEAFPILSICQKISKNPVK